MIEHHVAAPAVSAQALAPLEPGSPAWLELRRSGIGGSDAASALGLSPWRSAYELYLDKLGELEAKPPNDSMLWGVRLEPLVLQEYANRTGRRVVRPRTTFRSERHAFMLANLDGIADDRLVEAKTARSGDGWGESGSDEIPLAYLLQVQHYMAVTLKPVTDVAVLIGGVDFRLYEIPADREMQELLVEEEAAFWERVRRRDPPAPVSVEDARLRWGQLAVKGSVLATTDDQDAAQRLHAISDAMTELKGEADALKLTLMERLGEAGDVLVSSGGRPLVTWKLARGRHEFDVPRFTEDHPELVDAYMRTGQPSRRFLLKPL